MPRFFWLSMFALAVALLTTTRRASADEARHGYVVVAVPGATDIAWPLARGVYGSAVLKPAVIDDARARVLAGEPVPTGAGADLTELAELRAGVKGDDAASREVLAALAQKLSVHGIVVVLADPPAARVYDAATRAFDAAQYAPDAATNTAAVTWDGTVRSLERPFLPVRQPSTVLSTGPGTKPAATKKSESKAFYESPWFWVAIGTAALIGGGVLIATNVQTGDTLHLQMKTP